MKKPIIGLIHVTITVDASWSPKAVTFDLEDTAFNRAWLKHARTSYRVTIKENGK